MKTQFTVIVIGLVLVGLVNATPGKAPSSILKREREQIALIDMTKVFRKSREFNDLREALKVEIRTADSRAKAMADKIKSLKSDVMDTKDESKKVELQKQLIEATSKYESYRKAAKARFVEKEAEIYKKIYIRVQTVTAAVAKKKGHTIVFRFNSETPADAKDAKTILARMNRQVIYNDSAIDLTTEVLTEVNRLYRAKKKKLAFSKN